MKRKRIKSLDFLRGFAILVMILDHLFSFVFPTPITLFNIRFFTRIAEPLFALLFGYFLFNRKKQNLFYRIFEVFMAAFAVNIIFYSATSSFEILVSFLIVYGIYWIFKDKFVYFIPISFLYVFDPTKALLDYPLTIVLSQVSLGYAIRKRINPLISFLSIMAFPLIQDSVRYTLIFTLLAVYLLLFFLNKRNFSIEPINLMGRYPLLSYVTQYYLILFFIIIKFIITGE